MSEEKGVRLSYDEHSNSFEISESFELKPMWGYTLRAERNATLESSSAGIDATPAAEEKKRGSGPVRHRMTLIRSLSSVSPGAGLSPMEAHRLHNPAHRL
jgi:hypothetical protein